MKTIKLFIASLLALSVLGSCSDDNDMFHGDNTSGEYIFTVNNFKRAADSRTAIVLPDNDIDPADFVWTAGDTIGVTPNEGAQAYFVISGGEQSNKAAFSGGAWALKPSESINYAAYYPFIGDIYLDRTKVPVEYTGQRYIRATDGNLTSLAAYDFMAAKPEVASSSSKVNFNFEHLNSLVEVQFSLPDAGAIKSLKLTAEESIFPTKGRFDLTADEIAITTDEESKSKTFTVEVEGLSVDKNEVVSVFFMLAPTDISGKTLTATVTYGEDNATESFKLSAGKNMSAGLWYTLKKQLEVLAKGTCNDNITWMLTSDGTLTISGNGKMENYEKSNEVPWNNYRASIKKVIVEPGILYITRYAFHKCTNLTSITIPEGFQSVGSYAFSGCCNLENINLPQSDYPIGAGEASFNGCSKLKSITLREGTSKIYDSLFYGCTSLKNIVIPSSVYLIDMDAFNGCTSLESITIPENVTEIKSGAFYGCSSLRNINIPISVENIRATAFQGCSSLEIITIPEGVTSIEYNTFSDCSSLKNITIPNTIKNIDQYVFSGCSKLESITIPESVTLIGQGSFRNCSSLHTVISLATTAPRLLNYDVFEGTPSDKTLYYPAGSDYSAWAQYFATTSEIK